MILKILKFFRAINICKMLTNTDVGVKNSLLSVQNGLNSGYWTKFGVLPLLYLQPLEMQDSDPYKEKADR